MQAMAGVAGSSKIDVVKPERLARVLRRLIFHSLPAKPQSEVTGSRLDDELCGRNSAFEEVFVEGGLLNNLSRPPTEQT